MRRQGGFTLIEIMMVIAILGILGATAIPVYNTWMQRAYGSEAAIMMKQILDAEINYFLENDKFFPEDQSYTIYSNGTVQPSGVDVIKEIKENLNIDIPVGHPLEYYLVGDNTSGAEQFVLTVSSRDGDFDIFKGNKTVFAWVDHSGQTGYSYMSD